MIDSSELENGSKHGLPKKSSFGVRQIVLFVVLLLVLTAFLFDKYYFMPAAQAKIDLVANELSLQLNDGNRKLVHDRIGTPNSTFSYKGLDIEQYRFPRGLPFYHRPVLDIAYRGDAIAFISPIEPMTNEYIDAKLSTTKISELKEGERDLKVQAAGG